MLEANGMYYEDTTLVKTRFAFTIYTARWDFLFLKSLIFKNGEKMNRGPFIHGMARYSYANNKNNRMYRPVSLRRKIVNLIAFLLGVTLVVIVFATGGGEGFIASAFFFLGLSSVPFTMSLGNKWVMGEAEIAMNQKRAGKPLDIRRKKAAWGFVLMFAPLYILMQGSFFLPMKTAWFLPYIPVFMYTLIAVILSVNSAEALDFNTKKYKLIHLFLFIGIFAVGMVIRFWLYNLK